MDAVNKLIAMQTEDIRAERDKYKLECARLTQEKVELAKLVDRAVKMLWLAIPETREPVHSASNNPIVAWVADAHAALDKEAKP